MIKRAKVVARGAQHLCHHPLCDVPVPEARFACRNHWFQLPKSLRDDIWSTYVSGQEITKTPSGAYLNAATECIRWWDRHG